MGLPIALLAAIAFFAAAKPLSAADVSGRRMVWAHYVPWYTPDNASQMPHRFHSYPQEGIGANPFREEIERAMAQGIDGFFHDMVAHRGGDTSFWDLRPFLRAAEGTPFQLGICLDAKTDVAHQVAELVKMLSAYGDHPNYPKWKGRYVVCTYTFLSWKPDEWRAIRQGCEEAGFQLYLIANVETSFKAFDAKALEPYAETFERAYHFGFLGMDRDRRKSIERETVECATFCREHGAVYMPCVWPGYFGAWMMGVNCFYQPFCGFDTAQRRFDTWRLVADADWLHLTTYNDHGETSLMPRRLVTGNRAIVRAMAAEFKGEPLPREGEVVFSYLREVIPGTVQRFEAMRLPSADDAAASVAGVLRDVGGRVVATLPEKALGGGERWPRVEWLVPTTTLAESPVLVPEFTVRRGDAPARTVRTPRVHFAAGWLENPVTVKVSGSDCGAVASALTVSYTNDLLRARCDFSTEKTIRRAVLFRNGRPATAFAPSSRKVLNLFFSGTGDIELRAEGGARIVQAVKSGETNGAPNFTWTTNKVVSRKTPGWAMLSARIEAEADDPIVFSSNGKTVRFTPPSLVASGVPASPTRWTPPGTVAGGDARPPSGCVWLDEEGVIYNLPPLGALAGTLAANVWMTPPGENDAYWVEFELADGAFAESDVVYPFAKSCEPLPMNVIETPVTLDHPSGATGAPDSTTFITQPKDWPVRETKVVEARVSPQAIRRARFDFSGEPMLRPMLPHRRWPMGPFRLVCHFTRLARDGEGAARIVGVSGWNEGPELTLLENGKIEAAYAGGCKRGAKDENDLGTPLFRYAVQSLRPLEIGRKSEITVCGDGRRLQLWVDGELQGEKTLPPVRVYGNLSPVLGDGVNGEKPTTGLLHDLEIVGSPE